MDDIDDTLGRAGEELVEALRGFVVKDGDKGTQDRIVRAATGVFFNVLVPFMRRALAEGVYDVQLSEVVDESGEGKKRLTRATQEWEELFDS